MIQMLNGKKGLFILINAQELLMKVNGLVVLEMVKELKNGQMALSMKGLGIMEEHRAKVNLLT